MNLSDLIHKMGKTPYILIDHWGNPSGKGMACFDFSESILWDYRGIFINGELSQASNIKDIQNLIDTWKNQSDGIAAVGYISYNFKDILFSKIKFKNKSKFPYLFLAKPKKIYKYSIEQEKNNISNIQFDLLKDIISVNKYVDIINEIKAQLESGNAYQINYTMEKKYKLYSSPFDIYMKIRNLSEPRFGYFLDLNSYQILSFSPEQFFKTCGRKIYSYPMKGTIKRSSNKQEDMKYAQQLKQSIKDKAEHLMIVDLLRNDIGKISQYGTVDVKNLYSIESHQTVHQMVTEISGELKDCVNEFDIIKALFPGGSITGAPKESAMKIIDKIENYNRDLYTGAIGYIENNGNMNFNIPIRTMTIKNSIGCYPVGGGIVWDSIATEERKEAQLKSEILNIG